MSITIGICGGSASGKSTFTNQIKEYLGLSKCTMLSLDNYYIDFTNEESKVASVNYDQPDSLETDLFASHIVSLKMGKAVDCPIYDFTSHKRLSGLRRIIPLEYLIVEGLFLFNIPGLSDLFNLKIFIDTPSEVRLQRRIRRDSLERGRNKHSIIDQFNEQVQPMHEKYVEPNKTLSDIVLNGEQPFSDLIPEVLVLLSQETKE
jgi:uridine kinase